MLLRVWMALLLPLLVLQVLLQMRLLLLPAGHP
jgi:hypothetical protein